MSFIINQVINDSATIRIIGRVSSNEDLAVEVVDADGYNLSSYVIIGDKSDGMFNFEATAYLPGCHNFIGKHLVIRKNAQNQKSIKIGEVSI